MAHSASAPYCCVGNDMKKAALMILTFVCLFAATCQAAEKSTADIFALDTHISMTVYGDTAAGLFDAAELVVKDRENLWSVTLAESEISRINRADEHGADVSEETAQLVAYALQMAESTGGAFDPTIYPLVRAWGFTTDNYRVPSADEIENLLKLVDYRAVSVTGEHVDLAEGMQLDPGGIAKGYIGDELTELLKERGVRSAMINLGGNVHVIGSKPDGSAWKIGIKSPTDDGMLGVLSLRDQCAITSGAYERYFVSEDGEKYGHIMDPDTGYPVDNGVLSVTVIGNEGGRCDALSTAMFVMGADEACEYWKDNEGYEMILLKNNGVLYITEGITASFEGSDSELISEICVVNR